MAIRLAAIGFQHQHIFGLLDHVLSRPDVELVALAEHDDNLRARAVARHPVTAFADYRALLEQVRPDAAVVAAVNSAKPEVIADCATAGVHVFTDKPMATSLDGIARIGEAVRRNNTVLAMGVAGGYGASVAWKRLIDQGVFGRLVQFVNLAPHRLQLRPDAGWRRPLWSYEREQNGGIIVDLAIHGINTWRYLSGRNVVSVTASHGNKRFPQYPHLEDHAAILLTMDDGSTAFLAPSWLTPDAEPSHGREASFIIGTEAQLEVTSSGLVPGQERRQVILTTASQPPHRPVVEADHQLRAEDDFVEAIAAGRKPAIAAEFYLESQRIAVLARDAADQQRTVQC